MRPKERGIYSELKVKAIRFLFVRLFCCKSMEIGMFVKFVDLTKALKIEKNKDESLYWIKHFNFRLAVINVCPVLVPSELLLNTHLLTSEGWTAELTVDLWFVIPTTGFEPTQGDLTRFETLRLNHSATPIC